MSRVNAQLHREEGQQKPQPPLYTVEHPFLPSPFPVLWEPVRDPGTLQGKAVLVSPFLPLLEDMKRKTEPAQGRAGALCLLPSRCATYKPKNLQALAHY